MGLILQNITNRRLRTLFLLLIVANIFSGIFNFFSLATTAHKNPNDPELLAISIVEGKGLTKGYTDFWEANIRTYLTGNTINFIAVVCGDDNRLYTHRWLTDIGISKKLVNGSFYYYNPQRRYTQNCTPEIIPKQFGNPVETIDVGGSKLLIFDYDIGKMIR